MSHSVQKKRRHTMKKYTLVIITLLIFGHSMRAFADTKYLSSTYSFEQNWMSFTQNQYTDNKTDLTLILSKFTPMHDKLGGASLVLNFLDTGGVFDLFDYARVSYGNTKTWCEVKTGQVYIPISTEGLKDLNSTGKLDFTLERMYGDFTVKSAMLVSQPVPIPGTLLLLGPSLMGLLGFKKWIFKKHTLIHSHSKNYC
jgi:hypothetical protein